MSSFESLREEYDREALNESDLNADPIEQFGHWLQESLDAGVPEPHAMVLSTVDTLGQPSSRIVLLRGLSTEGFVFFTNYTSRKAVELSTNPQASLLFFWQPLQRQVRIEGLIKLSDPSISDDYFKERPRGSQIGAWASPQSATIPDRRALEENVERYTQRFADGPVERPSYWGGYILMPQSLELWQGRESRLHDRIRYRLVEGRWKIERLAP
jgi:pyridoxamine 5'-phosphate oxidase